MNKKISQQLKMFALFSTCFVTLLAPINLKQVYAKNDIKNTLISIFRKNFLTDNKFESLSTNTDSNILKFHTTQSLKKSHTVQPLNLDVSYNKSTKNATVNVTTNLPFTTEDNHSYEFIKFNSFKLYIDKSKKATINMGSSNIKKLKDPSTISTSEFHIEPGQTINAKVGLSYYHYYKKNGKNKKTKVTVTRAMTITIPANIVTNTNTNTNTTNSQAPVIDYNNTGATYTYENGKAYVNIKIVAKNITINKSAVYNNLKVSDYTNGYKIYEIPKFLIMTENTTGTTGIVYTRNDNGKSETVNIPYKVDKLYKVLNSNDIVYIKYPLNNCELVISQNNTSNSSSITAGLYKPSQGIPYNFYNVSSFTININNQTYRPPYSTVPVIIINDINQSINAKFTRDGKNYDVDLIVPLEHLYKTYSYTADGATVYARYNQNLKKGIISLSLDNNCNVSRTSDITFKKGSSMANCSDIAVKNMEKIYYGEFSNLGNDNLYFACSYTKTVAGKDSTTKDYFTIPIIEISNAKLTY